MQLCSPPGQQLWRDGPVLYKQGLPRFIFSQWDAAAAAAAVLSRPLKAEQQLKQSKAEQSRAEQRLKSRMERAAVLLAFGELFYPPTLLVSRLHFLAFGEPPRFFLHRSTNRHFPTPKSIIMQGRGLSNRSFLNLGIVKLRIKQHIFWGEKSFWVTFCGEVITF